LFPACSAPRRASRVRRQTSPRRRDCASSYPSSFASGSPSYTMEGASIHNLVQPCERAAIPLFLFDLQLGIGNSPPGGSPGSAGGALGSEDHVSALPFRTTPVLL